MLETKLFTRVKCDGDCGRWFGSGDYDWSVWETPAAAVDALRDYGWLVTDDGKHFCETCAPPLCDECKQHGHWDEDYPKLAAVSQPDGEKP